MKNGIEPRGCGVAELFSPIEGGQISRDEIAAVSSEVLEIPGAEIVDYREMRLRKLLLQREREIRADETSAASDNESR